MSSRCKFCRHTNYECVSQGWCCFSAIVTQSPRSMNLSSRCPLLWHEHPRHFVLQSDVTAHSDRDRILAPHRHALRFSSLSTPTGTSRPQAYVLPSTNLVVVVLISFLFSFLWVTGRRFQYVNCNSLGWKDNRGLMKRLLSNSSTTPAFAWRYWWKSRKTSVRKSVIPTEIRNIVSPV
jgi:hypothetical protein